MVRYWISKCYKKETGLRLLKRFRWMFLFYTHLHRESHPKASLAPVQAHVDHMVRCRGTAESWPEPEDLLPGQAVCSQVGRTLTDLKHRDVAFAENPPGFYQKISRREKWKCYSVSRWFLPSVLFHLVIFSRRPSSGNQSCKCLSDVFLLPLLYLSPCGRVLSLVVSGPPVFLLIPCSCYFCCPVFVPVHCSALRRGDWSMQRKDGNLLWDFALVTETDNYTSCKTAGT